MTIVNKEFVDCAEKEMVSYAMYFHGETQEN